MIYPNAYIKEHFNRVSETLAKVDNDPVFIAADMLKEAQKTGRNVFVCGNGGSAATASHFANDLMKMAGVKVICLNDMTPTILAYMNDDGIANMFAAPLEKLKVHGDALVLISCSGNSINLLALPKTTGLTTILLTGDNGGKLAEIAHVVIKAPHPDIRVQEDVHLAVCHALAGVLSEKWG